MKRLWPSRKQWKTWSSPSKWAFVGVLVAFFSLFLSVAFFTISYFLQIDSLKLLKPKSILSIDGKEMVLIPAGKAFFLGKSINVESFYIDKYEVTNSEYKRFIEDTDHPPPKSYLSVLDKILAGLQFYKDAAKDGTFSDEEISKLEKLIQESENEEAKDWYSPNKGDHPVENISWKDACAYSEWAGKRLPTELEWVRAARGENKVVYPWGNDFQSNFTNILDSGIGTTSAVGSFESDRSIYGVFDLAGNVSEWVAVDVKYISFELLPKTPEYILHGGAYSAPRSFASIDHRQAIAPLMSVEPGESLDVLETLSEHRTKRAPLLRLEGNGFRCVKQAK